MCIEIDYLAFTEQALIKNDGISEHQWNRFRSFITDYIPISIIDYSERSMAFPWRYFLSIKAYVGNYAKANSSEFKLKITDNAKEMLKHANDTSYESSIQLGDVSKQEIETRLEEVGFTRSLTHNQMNNLSKIANLPGAATFSVPGAGKTTEALAYFFVNCMDSDRLLVVAPKNAFGAWDEQLAECVPELDDKFYRLRGGEDSIQEILNSSPRFMLITYDQLPRVSNLINTLLNEGNVFMFLDESHRIKGGRKAKRAEVILGMAYLPKRKLVMSGTPMPQSAKDLIPQFSFLYPTKDVKEDNVVSTIQPIYVRTTQGQLGIPEIKHVVVTVQMPELQRKIYESLKSEMKRQMNPYITDVSRFALRRIGKCIMKVMEFVSNPSLLSDDMSYIFDQRIGELLLQTDGPKIDYVCRKARELAGQGKKVIIWSCFVQNVELIAMRLSDLGAVYIHGKVDAGSEEEEDTREGKIKRFHDDPDCMVMVANPAACSEGISLHKVCQYAIYLDRSFNAAHYLQSEDRIHRLGLPKGTTPIVEIVECKDSIDGVIRARLDGKVNAMAQALNDDSLRIDPMGYDYDDDEDADATSGLNIEDINAVMRYFFPEDSDD